MNASFDLMTLAVNAGRIQYLLEWSCLLRLVTQMVNLINLYPGVSTCFYGMK